MDLPSTIFVPDIISFLCVRPILVYLLVVLVGGGVVICYCCTIVILLLSLRGLNDKRSTLQKYFTRFCRELSIVAKCISWTVDSACSCSGDKAEAEDTLYQDNYNDDGNVIYHLCGTAFSSRVCKIRESRWGVVTAQRTWQRSRGTSLCL